MISWGKYRACFLSLWWLATHLHMRQLRVAYSWLHTYSFVMMANNAGASIVKCRATSSLQAALVTQSASLKNIVRH